MKNKMLGVLLVLMLLSFIIPQNTKAYAGFLDTGINPVEAGAGLSSSVSNGVTAGSSVTTSVMTTLEKVKHYVLDPLAWFAAKKIIQTLTAQTVNWINSGFQGNPAYVQDPGRFFAGIADNTASRFLSDSSLNVLCTPFRSRVRLALVQNYIQQDTDAYSCSLSILRNNYDQFMSDFTVGGWDGWLELTQNPSNNPYGSYLQAQSDLANRLGAQQNKYVQQLTQGRGFLSFQKCPQGMELDPALGTGDCRVEKKTVTPGSVIESQLENILPSGVRQLELADSFNEIVGALITQMLSRVIGGGGNNGGLSSASNPDSVGSPSLTNQLVTTETGPSLTALPVIALNGPRSITVRLGYVYNEPGFTAYDSNLGDLTNQVVVTNNSGGVTAATCNFEPFLSAVRAAQAARNYSGVAVTRWRASRNDDRDRLGDLSGSAREVIKYFQSVLEASKVLTPSAPRVELMKIQIGKILPAEQLISETALAASSASDNLSKGYTLGKVLEATEKLYDNGLFLIDDVSNQFTVIVQGIASNPAQYCALSANPPLGSVEGTFTVTYTVTTANGTASTTRTVIVSATAPIGQNETPIDNLAGGNELPGGNPGGCQTPPTAAERADAQASMDFVLNNLNSPGNLALCPQVAAPASQQCQDMVQGVVSSVNTQFPTAAALYYPGENVIGMPFTYQVGPNTNRVSNIIGPGDTWRGTFRVFCP